MHLTKVKLVPNGCFLQWSMRKLQCGQSCRYSFRPTEKLDRRPASTYLLRDLRDTTCSRYHQSGTQTSSSRRFDLHASLGFSLFLSCKTLGRFPCRKRSFHPPLRNVAFPVLLVFQWLLEETPVSNLAEPASTCLQARSSCLGATARPNAL